SSSSVWSSSRQLRVDATCCSVIVRDPIVCLRPLFSFECSGDPRHLHSFPTRRSSDLDDIAKGRLVVPFKMALPSDAGFYLVTPEGRTDPPKLRAFRQWVKASAQVKSQSAQA